MTEHELAELVEAARWAPTAFDPQHFRLVVVDDRAVIDQLARAGSLGDAIAGAPMLIAVVFDPGAAAPGDPHGMISLGCVLENLWLAASACRLDVQIMSGLAAAATAPEVKRVLGIPAAWQIAYALRLGHALRPAAQPRDRRVSELVVGRNHFA
ncbi:MAG TPA: nitroreductase family protein [Kofleriaceae bacterium]|nr:nitroreductase family protein [Kofleriaceae bacterium]